MNKNIFKAFFVTIFGMSSVGMVAQKQQTGNGVQFGKVYQQDEEMKCFTTENEVFLKQKHPKRANNAQFEAWLAPLVEQVKDEARYSESKMVSRVIKIPVVVHVIHSGQEVGVGPNIADEQVLSQIQVLNQDFRRMLGTPGHNNNPVGADVEIEFCMAQRTPDGEPTDGIDRVNTRVFAYTSMNQVESVLKPSTIWDSSRYLNIWVICIGGNEDFGGVLAYAQFPSATGLTGMKDGEGEAETDGVVIRYQAFGSRAIFPEGDYRNRFDLGRTATHEIGHWLGLRHIWGDGGCDVDDFCEDTPVASRVNRGCQRVNTCPDAPGVDMIENYMDYTDDGCKNVFTQDQKYRMIAVMHNAVRRSSLRESNACVPLNLQIEGGLSLESLNLVNCSNTFTPSVVLKNHGTTQITKAVIQYSIDDVNVRTFNWTGSLARNEKVTINLTPLTANSGMQTFYANLTSVNGVADDHPDNNEIGKEFMTNFDVNQLVFTLQKDYFGSEITWALKNSAGTTIYSGGPYADTPMSAQEVQLPLEAPIVENWNLPTNDCYTFTINDSGNDGINSCSGAGYYTIKTLDQTTVAMGGVFASSDSRSFAVTRLDANESSRLARSGEVFLYPNPVKEILNVILPSGFELSENYEIFNNLGQLVTKGKITPKSDLTINTSGLNTGVYFIKINKDTTSQTLKFVKN